MTSEAQRTQRMARLAGALAAADELDELLSQITTSDQRETALLRGAEDGVRSALKSLLLLTHLANRIGP